MDGIDAGEDFQVGEEGEANADGEEKMAHVEGSSH